MARENVAPVPSAAVADADFTDASRAAAIGDSFANYAARMGANASNLQGGASYQRNIERTRNYIQLEAMYRTSGLIRKAIDCVADDMTREGIDISGSIDPTDQRKLTQAIDELGIWEALSDTIRWGSLYGGAIGVLLIDGQDMATPLNLDSIRPGQFKGILAMDRWQLNPAINTFITDFGPDLGKPAYYDVMIDGSPLQGRRIHHSRVIRQGGARIPYRQSWTEQGWDASNIEVWWDRIIALDSTTMGAAQLVHKAHLRMLKVKGLRQIMTGPEAAKQGLYRQTEFMRVAQTIEGLTIVDSDDEFQTYSYAFSGLDNILGSMKEDFAAVVDIPMVRLFGQSPGGLNSTGDTDMELYNTGKIKQGQERKLRSGVALMLEVLHRSVLATPPAEDFSFTFRELAPMSEETKSKIFQQDATTIAGLVGEGMISRATGLQELQVSAETTGRGTKITDEDVTDAENDPPEMQPGYVAPTPEVDPNAPPANDDPNAE